MAKTSDRDQAIVIAAFARIDPVAMGVAAGSVAAVLLFAATAALLLKASVADAPVGPHLALLRVYLPGYSVSWVGGLIGATYAWVIGAAVGLLVASLWNFTHRLYIAAVLIRAMWWRFVA